jgi:hypothetical protein
LARILSETIRISLTWSFAVFRISHFLYHCFALTSVLHTAVLKPLFRRPLFCK